MNRGSLENLWAFVALCLIAVLLFHPPRTLAAPLPIALSPTRFEFAANRGDTLQGTMEFWNGSDAGLPVQVEAADFAAQDEQGHVTVGSAENEVNSLKTWIKPVYPSLTVSPRQNIHLDFSIMVPPNADPGTHWGVILVRTGLPGAGGTGASIQSSIGAIVLVNVYGDSREIMALESVKAPRFVETGPVALTLRFRNDGTVHEAPAGAVVVRNILHQEVSRVALPGRNVLPGSVRRVEVALDDGLWLGRYTADIEATYGRDRHVLVGSVRIWVVPWKKLLVEFGIATAFLVLLYVWRNRFGAAWHVLRTGEEPGAGKGR